MDRNSVIGLVLIIGILVGSSYLFSPSAEEIQAEAAKTEQTKSATQPAANSANSPVNTSATTDTAAVDSVELIKKKALLEAKFGPFYNAATGKEETKTIETDKLIITFSNKGGMVKDVVVKGFNDWHGQPVHLFEPSQSKINLTIPMGSNQVVNTADLFFDPIVSQTSIKGDEKTAVIYRIATENDGLLELIYTLSANKYTVDLQVNSKNIKTPGDATQKWILDWQALGRNNEKSVTIERQRASVFFKTAGEDRDYLSETSETDDEVTEEPLQWVAFKQYFFTAAVSAPQGFSTENAKLAVETPSDSAYTKRYKAQIPINMASATGGTSQLTWYFGPNTLEELSNTEIDQFDRIIDYGWGIFGWVNKYFIYYLFNWLNATGIGIGISILLLTIVIKMLLMPLTYKNYQSSAKMKILKPEIDALNEKHKNADPLKKQQDMMALYKKTGVNPLAGCIPVLIQMPILYAMFRFFPASIELRQKAFLWADDLSSFDSIYNFGFNIPLYGDHISLFTILMCASTFIYTRMNSANMPAPQPGMPDMRMIMYIFPFMMLFFFNNFSSGLSWYYFAANLVTMAQTLVIRKYFVNEAKLLAIIEENKTKPQGKSRFQRKMEEMAAKRGVKLPK
ncbi:MAG TPA: membrane protein insertase YidC [Luteibaculaceae bacterium]|nr:membrane protein insertase YidC [Luteibaculaceae bacterium]